MLKQNIPFQDIKLYRPIIESYLNKEDKVKPLVSEFFEEESIEHFIFQRQKFKVDREILFSAISNQYKNGGLSVPKSLDRIKDENTFTVTTGHQLNLLGGPLYFVYKIIATLNLAEDLNEKYTFRNFIPVFWMASEDHDFEEINSIVISGDRFTWNTNQGGAVGRFKVDNELICIMEEVSKKIEDNPFGENLTKIIHESYILNDSLANCTRRFVTKLISNEKLIIVDGDDELLKSEFKTISEKEINDRITWRNVSETDKYLKNFSYHSQVHVREINLFQLEENDRIRLTPESDNIKFDDLSPNALLRPVYQEKILPNIAYIGGAGEMAYWLQLKTTFESFNVNFPALVVRNSVLMTSSKFSRNLDKLKMEMHELFSSLEDLKKTLINRESKQKIDFSDEKDSLRTIFTELKTKVSEIDFSLVDKVGAENKRIENALKDLEKRLYRHQKHIFKSDIDKLISLKNEIFPFGTFQERILSVVELYSKHGEHFIKQSEESINVFDNSLKAVEL